MKRLFFLMVVWMSVMALYANVVENDTVVQGNKAQPSVSRIRIDPEILKAECPEAFTRYYKAKQLTV